MWPSLSQQASSRRVGECWRGYFMKCNNSTQKGGILAASDAKFQRFVKVGVRSVRMEGCCL